eukprot:gene8135-12596_t
MVETRSGNKGDKRERTKKEKDPNAPKRPSNAYFLYCSDNRNSLKEKNPELKTGQISKKLAAQWNTIDDATKKKYQKKFEDAKKEYEQKVTEYNASKGDSKEEEVKEKDEKKAKKPKK